LPQRTVDAEGDDVGKDGDHADRDDQHQEEWKRRIGDKLTNAGTDVFPDVMTLASCLSVSTPWPQNPALLFVDSHRAGCATPASLSVNCHGPRMRAKSSGPC
jgi:hypothetical protein